MTRPKLPKTIAKERRRTAPRESTRLTGWCPLCKMTVHFGERVMYYPRESRMEHIKCQEKQAEEDGADPLFEMRVGRYHLHGEIKKP